MKPGSILALISLVIAGIAPAFGLMVDPIQEGAGSQSTGSSALKGLDVHQPLDIDADRLELNDKDGTARLIGNVIVSQGALTLTTNSLLIYFDRAAGQENPEIRRIDALEPLKVVSQTETVTGSWGVYDVEKRIITIGGAVDLVRKDASIKGSLLQINLIDGVTVLDGAGIAGDTPQNGRVKGRFLAPPPKK